MVRGEIIDTFASGSSTGSATRHDGLLLIYRVTAVHSLRAVEGLFALCTAPIVQHPSLSREGLCSRD